MGIQEVADEIASLAWNSWETKGETMVASATLSPEITGTPAYVEARKNPVSKNSSLVLFKFIEDRIGRNRVFTCRKKAERAVSKACRDFPDEVEGKTPKIVMDKLDDRGWIKDLETGGISIMPDLNYLS